MTDVLVARRAAARRLVDEAAAARVATAPAGYLYVHDSTDVARHCSLLSTLPAADEVRVVVTPGRAAGEWRLDVGARDRVGLLASFTGVLAERRIDVVQAVLATWDDGAALQAFIVRSAAPPDCGALQLELAASLNRSLAAPVVFDATVEFDDQASPLYTACQVTAPDQPGLLHAVAVAFAGAGVDVHAAAVETNGRLAHDRFDLSHSGRKLGPSVQRTLHSAISTGTGPVEMAADLTGRSSSRKRWWHDDYRHRRHR